MKRKILDGGFLFLLLISVFAISGCENETKDSPVPNVEPASFIPRANVKYEYTTTEDGENIGTAIKWIDGSRDSSGLKLYNLHTVLTAAGESITLDDKLFVAKGKTYTKMNMPDAWYLIVEELKKSPDIVVEEAKVTGFPAYMLMENTLRKGSKITWEVPEKMGQYIRYKRKGAGNMVLEVTQELVQHPGEAEGIESITVPAGTFRCARFVYKISQEQILKVNGQTATTASGTETVTLWMAHGIGVVKQENVTIFKGATTSSTTILNKIK